MTDKPRVSLIIVPFDNFDFFEKAVNSVLENTDYSNFEVVISHNPCENEETNKKILYLCGEKFDQLGGGRFKYFINEKNLYHAAGCMSGFNAFNCMAKYVGFLNDDIFIPGNQIDWLSTLVSFMEEHSDVATITPCLLYPQKETIYWIGKQNPENPQHDFLHYSRSDNRLPTEPFETTYNNMAICLTRSELVKEIPLGQSCKHYGSDSEFCNRIKDKYPEMKHYVYPGVKCYHWNIFAQRENHGKDKVVDG